MKGTFPGGGGFPSIILPGRTKVFHYSTSFGPEHKEFFDFLWSQAAHALKRTDRLVLCGYSLLPVDERACDLLLKVPSRAAEVTVVSGSQGQRIAKQFKEAGFGNVNTYENGYFESWVEESAQPEQPGMYTPRLKNSYTESHLRGFLQGQMKHTEGAHFLPGRSAFFAKRLLECQSAVAWRAGTMP
jgi:hypothetical protein